MKIILFRILHQLRFFAVTKFIRTTSLFPILDIEFAAVPQIQEEISLDC